MACLNCFETFELLILSIIMSCLSRKALMKLSYITRLMVLCFKVKLETSNKIEHVKQVKK